MGELFHLDSPLMRVLGRLAELMILNVLALVCALPVVTLGASAAGLYTAVQNLVRDEGKPVRDFFRGFRRNFWQATLLWLIFLAAGVLLAFGLVFYASLEGMLFQILFGVTVLVAVLLLMMFSWSFPLQARFCNSIGSTLQNALVCAVAYFPRSLAMAALNCLPLALLLLRLDLFLYASVIWLLVWFGLAAYLNMLLLKQPFARMMAASEEQEPDQGDDDDFRDDNRLP